ncbi:uncharacterized protein LOC105644801 [Jatropha curcas]|uniref:uncharacterized protein LOC105644801 n=1 Tax=Jatropha curcas TaxID=180498 RepID=UPI0018959CE7|nr:uncharacterized protein LOC105644801 [Jatropha curcas]
MFGKVIFPILFIFFLVFSYSIFIGTVDFRSYFNPLLQQSPAGAHSMCATGPPLKVYMYDLPRKFHVAMMSKSKVNDDTPVTAENLPPWPKNSGLRKQHSVEYWLMASLLYDGGGEQREVVRVLDPEKADAFFVPFFSSLSFNTHGHIMTDPETEIDRQLQVYCRSFLCSFRFHFCSIYSYASILDLVMFSSINYKTLLATVFSKCLLYNVIVISLLTSHFFPFLTYQSTQGMRSSKFCLHPAGDTPSSCRLFDAIVSHCVPVIVSDQIELPYEDEIDYSEFSLFFSVKEAIQPGYMVGKLREFPKDRWIKMWRKLKSISHHFEFQYPPKKEDAVDMLWRQVKHKLPRVQLSVHRSKRLKVPDWWQR